MAYAFNGSTQYLQRAGIGSAGPSAWPMTVYARSLSNSASLSQVTVADMDSNNPWNGLLLGHNVANNFFINRFGSSSAVGGGSYSTGVWYSLGGRSRSNTDYDVVGDTTVTTGSTNTAFGIVGNFLIGARLIPALSLPLNGKVACVALWSAALDDAEMNSLYKGFSPRRIRPQSLLLYAPLVRELILPKYAQSGSPGALTNVASATVANHPRTYGM